jgi:hypothetical protein
MTQSASAPPIPQVSAYSIRVMGYLQATGQYVSIGCHVDPIGGCAPERMQFQNHVPPTFDPREEPGALAAHAGIYAGGEE